MYLQDASMPPQKVQTRSTAYGDDRTCTSYDHGSTSTTDSLITSQVRY